MKQPYPDIHNLLYEIRRYRERTGMTRTRFGLEAANDGHLISRLQAGREPRRDKIARVRKFMKRRNPT
jgi:hypothetical protein